MIRYTTSLEEITAEQLTGFCVGWSNPPSPETHLKILQGSSHVVLALDEASDRVIGFVTALSDGVICAYISLLEVLPSYQKRGIGKELVSRMLRQLEPLYAIDLLCDPKLQGFYEKVGMIRASGMLIRNFERQSGV